MAYEYTIVSVDKSRAAIRKLMMALGAAYRGLSGHA